MWQRCSWSDHGEYEITCVQCGDKLISNNSENWRRRWIYYVIWQFVSSIGNSTTSIPRWAFLSFLSILLLVVHFPNSDQWSGGLWCFCWRECRFVWRSCWKSPTKWKSKTVELQNFISEQASHHFVFCHRKLDWHIAEKNKNLSTQPICRGK